MNETELLHILKSLEEASYVAYSPGMNGYSQNYSDSVVDPKDSMRETAQIVLKSLRV